MDQITTTCPLAKHVITGTIGSCENIDCPFCSKNDDFFDGYKWISKRDVQGGGGCAFFALKEIPDIRRELWETNKLLKSILNKLSEKHDVK